MAISDTERREVAAKLSGEAQAWSDTFHDEVCDLGDVSALMQDLCYFAGLSGKVPCGNIFQRFADLIDRPTTTRHGKFRTKYGRETPCCEVCGYSIGDMRWGYCPKCGAVITDD